MDTTSSSIIMNDTMTTPPTMTMSNNNNVEIISNNTLLSIIQIVISGCVFIGLSILITAVLSNKKTRQQPFNIYLISLELVDLIMNGVLVATYVWALFNNNNDNRQQQQQSYNNNNNNNNLDVINVVWITTDTIVIFATFVNVYLSGIIAYQIHRLLMNSYRAIRVKPPTKLRITIETSIVYLFGFALAVMYIWSSVVKSNKTRRRRMSEEGGGGVSMEEDDNGSSTSSAKMAWGLCCGVLLLPLSYILYVTIQIYQKKLLAMSNNRTRSIAIYFGRIVFVFIVFYVPGTIFFAFGVASVLVDDNITQEGWTKLIIGTIILALQGAFSFVIALTKDDIRDAVVVFLRCNNNNSSCCCRQRQRRENNNNVDYDDGTDDVECGKAANHTPATPNETPNDEAQSEEIQNEEESESLPDDDDPTILREDPAVPSGHERNLGSHRAGSEGLLSLRSSTRGGVPPQPIGQPSSSSRISLR